MFARGTVRADGACGDLEFTVGTEGAGNYKAVISGHVDDSRQVWVDQSTWTRTAPQDEAIGLRSMLSPAVLSAGDALMYGFTKSEMNGILEIDLATAFAELIDWDNGARLSGGQAYRDCNAFAGTGWRLRDCIEYHDKTTWNHNWASTKNKIGHAVPGEAMA